VIAGCNGANAVASEESADNMGMGDDVTVTETPVGES
jgi:hypothetical protein